MEKEERLFNELHHDPGYRDDDYRDLVELIEATPEPDRTIIKAHAQGYGYKEIAQITGLSIASSTHRRTPLLYSLTVKWQSFLVPLHIIIAQRG